jgi:hypothetical protein
MLNLFRTFAGTTVWDREHCIRRLAEADDSAVVVAKRTPHCATHLAVELATKPEIWVVEVLRDPRDVVTSILNPEVGYYCDFPRWERDILTGLAIRGVHLRTIALRYETIVNQPNHVQEHLASILNLTPSTAFTSFPSVVPEELSPRSIEALGGVRPINAHRVGRWMHTSAGHRRVADQLHRWPRMEGLLRAVGYPPTPENFL